MIPKPLFSKVPAAVFGVLILSAGASHAADRFWNNTDTDFNNSGSWTGGAPGINDRGVFDTAASIQPNLTASTTIQGISFNAGGTGYLLTGNGGTILTLTSTSNNANAAAAIFADGGTNTIAANITFGSTTNASFTLSNGADLIVSGNLSGSANLFIQDSSAPGGEVTLSGDNSGLTGGITHTDSGGVILNLASANALGTGVFSVQSGGSTLGGRFDNTSGGALSLVTNGGISLPGNGGRVVTFIGSDDLHMGNATVTVDANRTIRVSGSKLTFGGSVTDGVGTFTLTKDGAGTLELQAASTYDGATFVRGVRTPATTGVLLLTGAGTISGANLTLQDSGVLGLGNGNFTRSIGTGVGQVNMNNTGGGFTSNAGFAAYGANRIVNLGGSGADLTWGTNNFVGSTFILGAADADAMVDFQNPILLTTASGGQSRVVQVEEGSAEVDGRLSGVLSGAGGSGRSLTKAGAGTLQLTAENTYEGTIFVNEGRMLVDGDQSTATGTITVASGATLGGMGNIGGAIALQQGGKLAPGSVGADNMKELNGTSLTWDGEATIAFGQMAFELSNVDNTSDLLALTGSFGKGSGSFFVFDFLGTGAADQTYTLMTFGSSDFDVTDFDYNGLAGGLSGDFTLNGTSLQFTTVPEPTSAILVSIFGLTLLLRRRQRR